MLTVYKCVAPRESTRFYRLTFEKAARIKHLLRNICNIGDAVTCEQSFDVDLDIIQVTLFHISVSLIYRVRSLFTRKR